ncbi:MAG: YbaB/EbfC family nucleoid-associated protein [Bdellovibrionales bacterium]|nr:YbaB/EbfC family nucleoid-associated protein [Bdellovibrionales bacterium]NQZ17719.1 YbaB/EbfC family nucleoid-associated protein [Bdellovibrionales bacterium]
MKGKGRGNSMQNLIRQANQMQAKMKQVQEELAEKEYQGTSGGGAVKVTIKGENNVSALTIDPEIFKEGDAEMLQDMLVTALNDALTTAKKDQEEEMGKVTGNMNIPGLF